jgi:hypothetical protein
LGYIFIIGNLLFDLSLSGLGVELSILEEIKRCKFSFYYATGDKRYYEIVTCSIYFILKFSLQPITVLPKLSGNFDGFEKENLTVWKRKF